MATLSGVGQPLNESSILAAALTLPLSLFLTSIRISYQAFILHYLKKLKVYAKPPLFVGQTVQPINAVDAKQAQQGSIHWIQPSRDQIYLRSLFEAILSERVKQSHIPVRITIEPADFTQTSLTISNTEIATEAESQFTLRFHSYHAFQELFMAPSLQHAFQVSIANGWIEVNQPQIFVDFFNKHCPHNHHGPMRKAIQQSRRLHHRWSSGEWTQADEWPLHAASWRLLGILLKVLLSDVMSYVVFKLLRAEFVQGESPWDTCRRLGGPATVQGGSIQSESERDGSYHFRASSVLQHGEVLGCNDHRL